jgi:hypothetical protein
MAIAATANSERLLVATLTQRRTAREDRAFATRTRAWRAIASVQGIYFLTTGLWPAVHIDSFLAITGPKTDLWLVQFFGFLVCILGLVLLHASWRGALTSSALLTGLASAGILAGGDIYFVWRRQIGPIYLLDAALEFIFLIVWLLVIPRPFLGANHDSSTRPFAH